MEKIRWTDHVRNEELLHRVKLERNVLQTIERRKADWIGHRWRRNCLLKHVIEGKVERRKAVIGRRKRRRKQLLDDLRETRRYMEIERGSAVPYANRQNVLNEYNKTYHKIHFILGAYCYMFRHQALITEMEATST